MNKAKDFLNQIKAQRFSNYATFDAYFKTQQALVNQHATTLQSELPQAVTHLHLVHILNDALPNLERLHFAHSLIHRLRYTDPQSTSLYNHGVKRAFEQLTVKDREKFFAFINQDANTLQQWSALQPLATNATPKSVQREYKNWTEKFSPAPVTVKISPVPFTVDFNETRNLLALFESDQFSSMDEFQDGAAQIDAQFASLRGKDLLTKKIIADCEIVIRHALMRAITRPNVKEDDQYYFAKSLIHNLDDIDQKIENGHRIAPARHWRTYIQSYGQKDFIKALEKSWHFGFGAEIKKISTIPAEQSPLPEAMIAPIRNHFRKWIVKPYAPVEPVMYPNIVEVDHALLMESQKPAQASYGKMQRVSAKGPGIHQQPQISWLVDALMRDGIPASAMTIYREKATPEIEKSKAVYEVLKVSTKTIDTQIAVCLTKGHSSYVMKTPELYDFSQDATVEIGTLQNDPDAYQVKCYERGVWVSQMVGLIKADKNTLGQQIKKNTQWKNLYAETIESVAAFYNTQGRMPYTHDMDVISHGPLTSKSTFRRVYLALLRDAIPELARAEVHTFPQLLSHIKENHASLLKPRTLQDAWAHNEPLEQAATPAFNETAKHPDHMPAVMHLHYTPK